MKSKQKMVGGTSLAFVGIAMLFGVSPAACSSDEEGSGTSEVDATPAPSAGGADGSMDRSPSTGGAGGTGGSPSGGGTGGSGGVAGPDGGPEAGPDDGGPEAGPDDGGSCAAPMVLVYESPGCNGSVQPTCAGPLFDACYNEVCACDGTTIGGCGAYHKPYRHDGPCTDAAPDGG